MKQCPYCGFGASDDARFCTNCGKSFPRGQATSAPQPNSCAPETTILTPQQDSYAQNAPPFTPQQPNSYTPDAAPFTPQQPNSYTPDAAPFTPQQPNTYTPNAAQFHQPRQFEPTSACNPDVNDLLTPKKHKLWPWLVGAAVVLALIGVLVYFLFLRSTPTSRVHDAQEKTKEAMHEQFENCENLVSMLKELNEIGSAENLYLSADISVRDEENDLFATVSGTISEDVKAGEFMIKVDDGEQLYLSVEASADKETVVFRMPGLFDRALSLKLDADEQELQNSALFAQSDVSELLDGLEQLRSLMEPLEDMDGTIYIEVGVEDVLRETDYEEVGKETLTLGGKKRECTVYRATCDLASLTDGEYKEYCVFVDDRGYNVGAEITLDDNTKLMILLSGAENPCSTMEFYVDSEEILTVDIEKTDDGCELDFGEFTMEINDEVGIANLYVMGEELTFSYDIYEDYVYLSGGLEVEGLDLFVSTSLRAADKPAEMLSGDVVDVLSMSEAEIAELYAEIYDNATENSSYAWLLDSLASPLELAGEWHWQYDLSGQLQNEIDGQLPFEFTVEEPLYLDFWLNLDEDGTYELTYDEELLAQGIETFRGTLVEPMTNYLYESLESSGADRETIDAAFQEKYEMTVEEYVTQTLAEAEFTYDFGAYSGTYSIDGETVHFDGGLGDYDYYEADGSEFLMAQEADSTLDGAYVLFEKTN